MAPLAQAAAVLVEPVGIASLVQGYRVRIAAFVMFLYLIPAMLLFHNFWAFQGAVREDLMIHFLKNVAIMGGLLSAGGFSLDAARPPAR